MKKQPDPLQLQRLAVYVAQTGSNRGWLPTSGTATTGRLNQYFQAPFHQLHAIR